MTAACKQISVLTLFWLKKVIFSYLGLTAHFYYPNMSSIQRATLTVRKLPHNHTGL